SSRENSASRTRSLVGRVAPLGTVSVRPPDTPDTILVTAPTLRRAGQVARRQADDGGDEQHGDDDHDDDDDGHRPRHPARQAGPHACSLRRVGRTARTTASAVSATCRPRRTGVTAPTRTATSSGIAPRRTTSGPVLAIVAIPGGKTPM